MSIVMGVDIGIASIGICLIDKIENKIIFSHVHLFDKGEKPDGESLASERRRARSARRTTRRKARRRNNILKILNDYNFQGLKHIVSPEYSPKKCPWTLRKEALERLLLDEEFALVLLHIAKKRGAKRNNSKFYGEINQVSTLVKDEVEEDLEEIALAEGEKYIRNEMRTKGFKTFGSYISGESRKTNRQENYSRTVTRNLIREEVRFIFERQRGMKNTKVTQEFQQEYEDACFYEHPMKSFENMVGFCSLENSEKRAPAMSYRAELFVLHTKINNMRICEIGDDVGESLTPEQRKQIYELAFLKKEVTYANIRKKLNVKTNLIFNLNRSYYEGFEEEAVLAAEEKSKFISLKGYHTFLKKLKVLSVEEQEAILDNPDLMDKVAWILSFCNDEIEIRSRLKALNLSLDQIEIFSKINNFKGTINLSIKAIKTLLPFLEAGDIYTQAVGKAGYNQNISKEKCIRLNPFENLYNPVVNRALAQFRKVFNEIVAMYGVPDKIHIESARDIRLSYDEREKHKRKLKRRHVENVRVRERAKEVLKGDEPKPYQIEKYRYWEEQEHRCIYTDRPIDIEQLLRDKTYAEVEHVIPWARSYDDSQENKVISLKSFNFNKSNKTPAEYFKNKPDEWEAFQDRVKISKKLSYKKKNNLLMEKFDEERWKNRSLNDTSYIARELRKHLEGKFQMNTSGKKAIFFHSGRITSHLRKCWGFQKNRDDHRHHAVDAIIVACTTEAMVQKVTQWHQSKYKDRSKYCPSPWDSFRNDVLASISNIFISKNVDRKITGKAHDDTIKREKNGKAIDRVPLKELDYKKLEKLVDLQDNNGFYKILKERLDQYGGNGEKAFSEPLILGPNEVKKVSIESNKKSLLPVQRGKGIKIKSGLAEKCNMIRVDVFEKEKQFFLMPIYAHHFAKGMLPEKLVKRGGGEKDWFSLTEEYKFKFSLFKGDYIRCVGKKVEFEGYYVNTNISTNSITIDTYREGLCEKQEGIGVKTLLKFEKYAISYLGQKNLIRREVRVPLSLKKFKKHLKSKKIIQKNLEPLS